MSVAWLIETHAVNTRQVFFSSTGAPPRMHIEATTVPPVRRGATVCMRAEACCRRGVAAGGRVAKKANFKTHT